MGGKPSPESCRLVILDWGDHRLDGGQDARQQVGGGRNAVGVFGQFASARDNPVESRIVDASGKALPTQLGNVGSRSFCVGSGVLQQRQIVLGLLVGDERPLDPRRFEQPIVPQLAEDVRLGDDHAPVSLQRVMTDILAPVAASAKSTSNDAPATETPGVPDTSTFLSFRCFLGYRLACCPAAGLSAQRSRAERVRAAGGGRFGYRLDLRMVVACWLGGSVVDPWERRRNRGRHSTRIDTVSSEL